MPSETAHSLETPVNQDNQNHFVIMVKECIDSPFALSVMQTISEGDISLKELFARVPKTHDVPAGNTEEIVRIVQKVRQYTLVEEADASLETLRLTSSGREFLSILADIERLKSRFNN